VPAANANGNNYGNFTFQVQDGAGVANGGKDTDTTARLFTINVTSVNDAPQSTGGTATILEGPGAYTIKPGDFGFLDPNDTPSNAPLTLQISAVSLNGGTLTNNGTPIVLPASVAFTDITANKLIYTPASATANGNATISFKIQDNGGLVGTGAADTDVTTRTLTISITPVNTPPVGVTKTIDLAEDVTYTVQSTDFGFNDSLDNPSPNTLAGRHLCHGAGQWHVVQWVDANHGWHTY